MNIADKDLYCIVVNNVIARVCLSEEDIPAAAGQVAEEFLRDRPINFSAARIDRAEPDQRAKIRIEVMRGHARCDSLLTWADA